MELVVFIDFSKHFKICFVEIVSFLEFFCFLLSSKFSFSSRGGQEEKTWGAQLTRRTKGSSPTVFCSFLSSEFRGVARSRLVASSRRSRIDHHMSCETAEVVTLCIACKMYGISVVRIFLFCHTHCMSSNSHSPFSACRWSIKIAGHIRFERRLRDFPFTRSINCKSDLYGSTPHLHP